MYIGFWFLFFIFYFFLRICGLVLPVYHLLGCFFCLDWVCFTFRIDVGHFCGLALLQKKKKNLDFSSKFFWDFFVFFCLKVEQIIFFFNLRVFLILLEGVPHFFLNGKQIKKFNYYI